MFTGMKSASLPFSCSLFLGVVVENFSYVFQLTGGSKTITRVEMRAFKKVWAEFANPKTQHLERSKFVPFFAVSGLFSATSDISPTITAIDWDLRSEGVPS